MYGLVTRNEVTNDGTVCEGYEWLKENTLPIDKVLRMMTINAAYALFRENEVGSLEPGKYADLIMLSNNPLVVPAETLLDTAVWLTMVGGQTAYCAAGHENLCPQPTIA